jgi:hypothetical protein
MPRIARKTVPWMLALEAAMVMRDHWGRLPDDDRRELVRIVRASRGRPGNLTKRERSELVRIAKALDVVTAGRRLMPLHGGLPRSRR